MALRKAVFIDKDGTLIVDVPHNVDPGRIQLMAGAESALALLRRHGYELFIVSNQPGVALGRFSQRDLKTVEARVTELLSESHISISGYYWCPHSSESKCFCRKPEAGLIFRAASEHGIDLGQSWMIGDILHDVEAGHRAGCRSVFLESGNETEWELSRMRFPDYMAIDLEDAAGEICRAGAAVPRFEAERLLRRCA